MLTQWRSLVAVGLALTLGCSSLLDLDALAKADCAADGCAGTTASAGTKSHDDYTAGSSQAEAGSAPVAGSGGSGSSVGGTSAGVATGGDGSGGSGGNAAASGSAGAEGSSAGMPPVAGGPTGGTGGGPGVDGCQPSASDQSCDGLDEACQTTTDDAACDDDCVGTFVNGTSYMSCFADSDFDQAEATCRGNGMHLVKIDDALEDETVHSLAPDDYVWVGGSNLEDLSVFSWLDGTPFYDFDAELVGAYENFAAGEPYQDERWRCVEQDADGTWSTWDCSDPQSFVCERY